MICAVLVKNYYFCKRFIEMDDDIQEKEKVALY